MIAYNPHIKRCIDFFLSALAILWLAPFFVVISILICIDSKGPPFFIQQRFGRGVVPFRLIKFRSMAFDEFDESGGFNPGDSRRVTKIGRLLRNTKIDELPELFNILKGDMSFVGPRPEVAKYVNAYLRDFEVILIVRPGLSDFASVKYRDEEQILADKTDPEKYYRNVILPDKLQIARSYVDNITFKLDLAIIRNTLMSVMGVFIAKNN